jgi:uncharacterized protein (DUF2141 family)
VLHSGLFPTIILSTLVSFSSLFAQGEQAQLSINFEGLTSSKGKIMIRISNKKGADYKLLSLSADTKPLHLKIQVLLGSYAIAAYHDENNNNKLDKSFAGIPNEKYGFSNNVRGIFGPPKLSDQLVEVQQQQSIAIRLE